MYKIVNPSVVSRSDGAQIPADPNNADYVEYLAWVGQGNTPAPADIPDPKIAIRQRISDLEREQLMPRATREFMLLFLEANGMTAIPAYAVGKAFDNVIIALRNQL